MEVRDEALYGADHLLPACADCGYPAMLHDLHDGACPRLMRGRLPSRDMRYTPPDYEGS